MRESMESRFERKLQEEKQRQYLKDHYGPIVDALAFESGSTFTAEEALVVFISIKNRMERAAGHLLEYDKLLAAVESLLPEEKAELRTVVQKHLLKCRHT